MGRLARIGKFLFNNGWEVKNKSVIFRIMTRSHLKFLSEKFCPSRHITKVCKIFITENPTFTTLLKN